MKQKFWQSGHFLTHSAKYLSMIKHDNIVSSCIIITTLPFLLNSHKSNFGTYDNYIPGKKMQILI